MSAEYEVWWNPDYGDLQQRRLINAGVTKFHLFCHSTNISIPTISSQKGQTSTETYLEERWRLGRGLGVSFLRLWLGEWLSPRWPLQEVRSLLQENRN